MKEKEKNKHGDRPTISRRVMFLMIAVILAIPFFFFTLSLFDAIAWGEVYTRLIIIVAYGLGIFIDLLLVAAFFNTPSSNARVMLGITLFVYTGYLLTVAGTALILAYLSFFFLPITFGIIAVWGVVLMVRRRPAYLSEGLALMGIASIFSVTLLMFQLFWIGRYEVHESTTIGDRSYHLISFTGPLDPTYIYLFECNAMGLFCEEVCAPHKDYYPPDDQFSWEMVDGKLPKIDVFVNDKRVCQQPID